MPCGPKCACDPGIECLSVLDPIRFGFFKEWCESEDETKRIHVRNRSKLGLVPISVSPTTEPSIFRKVANFGRAIVTHAVAGFPDCGDKEAARRLSICRACEKFDIEKTACRVCGCNLDIKARWTEQKCPFGKW